mmetsp:Transcript_32230/g.63966  ORF Transcript_32230/g.63966 Transcript_32230/m.63966 type:complete len:321 (+) Transcript_32230:165-1127(+)
MGDKHLGCLHCPFRRAFVAGPDQHVQSIFSMPIARIHVCTVIEGNLQNIDPTPLGSHMKNGLLAGDPRIHVCSASEEKACSGIVAHHHSECFGTENAMQGCSLSIVPCFNVCTPIKSKLQNLHTIISGCLVNNGLHACIRRIYVGTSVEENFCTGIAVEHTTADHVTGAHERRLPNIIHRIDFCTPIQSKLQNFHATVRRCFVKKGSVIQVPRIHVRSARNEKLSDSITVSNHGTAFVTVRGEMKRSFYVMQRERRDIDVYHATVENHLCNFLLVPCGSYMECRHPTIIDTLLEVSSLREEVLKNLRRAFVCCIGEGRSP